MLDDLKYIQSKDKSDALGVAGKQWVQLVENYDSKLSLKRIDNIVVAGMGGSALAASFISTWPKLKVPFEIVRGYNIPDYVGENTLFIASSYSGNTEETLSALNQAKVAQAQIVVITSGGELEKIAISDNYPLYKMPENFQPRMAVFYNFAALIKLFSTAKFVDSSIISELNKSSEFIKGQSKSWAADVPSSNNLAKQIALEMIGKSPVIYGGVLSAVAYKWKINFNENAKNVAWCNQLPEFNHNEFMGWTAQPIEKPYAPVFLQSKFDSEQITRRFEISAKLLSGKMPSPIIVEAKGDTLLEQMLYTITLGDFVSLYTALLNGIDPTPVNLIEKLKAELAK